MIRINLLGEKRDLSFLYLLQTFATFVVVVGFVSAVTIHYLENSQEFETLTADKENWNQSLARLSEKTKKVEDLDKKRAMLKEKVFTMARLKIRKREPVILINDLSLATPNQAWLTSVSDKSSVMEISGLAIDPQTVSNFMRQMETNPKTEKVDLVAAEKFVKDGVPLQKFSILVKRKALDTPKETAKEAPKK